MTVRREMGRDIGGACGQLRKKLSEKGRGGRAMNSYGQTDTGRVRKSNQDSIFLSETPVGPLSNLFMVAGRHGRA